MDQPPSHHGEFYFKPEMSQWRNALLQNRKNFFRLDLWGQSAAKVRALLKMPTDCPIVLTGHQPIFFYPGIWAKCLAASQLAQVSGAMVYHKLTDTAMAPEFVQYIPEVDENGKASRREVEFFVSKESLSKKKTMPYAFLPSPDKPALEKIFTDAVNYGPPSVRQAVKYYSEKLTSGLKINTTWNQFHLHTLDLLNEISGTKRATLVGSSLWESEPFLDFLVYWLNHIAEFNQNYNDALNEYRKKHGITHEIEPMPNLKFEDWYFELPFWGTTPAHRRDSIWVKMEGRTLKLKVKGIEGNYSFHLDNLKGELTGSTLKIWPKAIPQTLFCRMYLCDFFIHGIGGGAYEEVGDLFFQKTTQLAPPAYGVVSATYFINEKESRELDIIFNYGRILGLWKRALEQNPEYLFTRQVDWKRDLPAFTHGAFEKCLKNERLKRMVDEKSGLLNELKDPLKRLQASQRIKELNSLLYSNYTEVLGTIEQGLADYEAVKETRDVLAFREYPFFCFEPEVFLDMKTRIKQASEGESIG